MIFIFFLILLFTFICLFILFILTSVLLWLDYVINPLSTVNFMVKEVEWLGKGERDQLLFHATIHALPILLFYLFVYWFVGLFCKLHKTMQIMLMKFIIPIVTVVIDVTLSPPAYGNTTTTTLPPPIPMNVSVCRNYSQLKTKSVSKVQNLQTYSFTRKGFDFKIKTFSSLQF